MPSIENVNDVSPRRQYTASAAQTAFTYPFPIFEDDNLVVDVDGSTQALSTDYTVSGAGDDTGGTVTFVSPMSGGEIVTIYRDIPIERLTDFQTNGPFASATMNDELDRITLVEQQLESKIDRTVKMSPLDTSDDDDLELPSADERAGKYFSFDANGRPSMSDGTGNDSALRTDLASTVSGNDGSRLVGFRRTETGSVAMSVWAVLNQFVTPQMFGAVGDGVTNDYAALNNWINCGSERLYAPAGTYQIGTDSLLTVPTGCTVLGDGPATIFRKNNAAFTTDVFRTTGDDIAFRHFRMVGANDTEIDGIATDGGARITIEHIQGFQLSSTVTIGLTTATSFATVRHVFSDDNTQQGVHFNKATSPRFSNLRADGIGTTNLHHGLYVGNCTDVVGDTVESTNCAGSGVHIFAQTSFTFDRCEITNINCRANGTSGAGNRAGVLVARDSSSTMRGVVLTNVTCYNNNGFNVLIENVDECQINFPYIDGNNEAITNGIYLNTTFAITTNYKIIGGHSKAHISNIRIPVSAGATVNVEVDQILVADADTGGSVGIFANGAGACNLYLGARIRFSNNATNIINTASGGGGTFHYGTTIPASTYTGTLTGISGTDPTGSVGYSVNGDEVTLAIPAISGTSDAAPTTLTGMPTVIRPATAQTVVGLTTDNGVQLVSRMDIATSGTITLYAGTNVNFNAVGTKAVGPCTVTYKLTA